MNEKCRDYSKYTDKQLQAAGVPAGPKTGAYPYSPPTLSRGDEGLLLVLLFDLNNRTSASKHI
jgi:hypothetical protein